MAIKEKNGKYLVDTYDLSGKRIRKIFEKKYEASAYEAKLIKLKSERRLVKARVIKERVSFDKILSDFQIVKDNLREKSVQKYTFIINQFRYFLEALDINYLDEFTPDHGTMLYNELIKERLDPKGNTDAVLKAKPSTINFFLQTVKTIFREEVSKGNIRFSPVQHLKNLKRNKKRPEFYSENELIAFFAQKMVDAYRNAFIALLHTGMRVGELENLTWNDIDFKRKVVNIRPKENFNTKTYYSERNIPMTNDLFELLEKLSKNKKSEIYPFCSVRGDKLRERKLLKVCKTVGKAAGIKGNCYLHKFRHTYATHLLQHKVPITTIQKLMGHSSISETMIYSHVYVDDMHDDVAVLNNLGKSHSD